MRYDFYQAEREAATVHPNGTKSFWKPYEYNPLAAGLNRTGIEGAGYFWMPKATKPLWQYTFKTRDQFIAKAKAQSEAYDAHLRRKAEERASRKPSEAALKMADPGAIFSYSWGYDQTNIEYFQVIKRVGATVTIADIYAESASDGGGMTQEHIRPTRDAFKLVCGHPKTRWDGKPGVCGESEGSLTHHKHWARASGQIEYDHDFVPSKQTQTKKVSVSAWGNGEKVPMLSFDHGCGTLVKQVITGNMPPLVVGSDYKTAFGFGH